MSFGKYDLGQKNDSLLQNVRGAKRYWIPAEKNLAYNWIHMFPTSNNAFSTNLIVDDSMTSFESQNKNSRIFL